MDDELAHSAGLNVSHDLNFDSEPFFSRLDCSPNPRPVPSLEDRQQPRCAIPGTIYLVKKRPLFKDRNLILLSLAAECYEFI